MDDKDYGSDNAASGARRAKLEQQLRRLEVEAYCAVVSAFRAQGELTWKKAQLLQDLRQVLRVPEERHKMELKRVTDDETLCELAKLSSSLHMGESELDATLDESAKARAGARKKSGKGAWGDNKEKNLPYLDAVVAPTSAQAPNLSKIPPAAKEGKAKAGAVGKAKSATATPVKPAAVAAAAAAKPATPAATANRKRKASTPAAAVKKGGAVAAGPAPLKRPGAKQAKTEVAKVEASEEVPAPADMMVGAEDTGVESNRGEMEVEEELDDEEANIKEVEEQLRAKQEQLRAELAALQAEMEDEEEPEDEEGPGGLGAEEETGDALAAGAGADEAAGALE